MEDPLGSLHERAYIPMNSWRAPYAPHAPLGSTGSQGSNILRTLPGLGGGALGASPGT
jgi:hypothetical protein